MKVDGGYVRWLLDDSLAQFGRLGVAKDLCCSGVETAARRDAVGGAESSVDWAPPITFISIHQGLRVSNAGRK
jgi:hypothetical protein